MLRQPKGQAQWRRLDSDLTDGERPLKEEERQECDGERERPMKEEDPNHTAGLRL